MSAPQGGAGRGQRTVGVAKGRRPAGAEQSWRRWSCQARGPETEPVEVESLQAQLKLHAFISLFNCLEL